MIKGFDGHYPQISDKAWVAESAIIIGQVTISDGASIWPGAVLRGDIEPIIIGEGSNIQDNAVCHTSHGLPCTVGKNVTVGHGAILHGCKIGDGSLIGMGATILDGALVENGCLVAAGAVLSPRIVVNAGNLVAGIPARPKKILSDKEKEEIINNSQWYQELAQKYAKEENSL